jgi:hypothetical protein
MVGNDSVNQIDALGLEISSTKSIISGRDIGCYYISPKMTTYKSVEREVTVTLPDGREAQVTEYGIDFELQLVAYYRWGQPGCDGCGCKDTKMVQFANSGIVADPTKTYNDRRGRRTIKDGIYKGWRVDAGTKSDLPYVSDTPSGSSSTKSSGSFSGWITDGPGVVRGTKKIGFLSCIVCTSGKDAGKVLGCVSWGMNASNDDGNGRAGAKNVTGPTPRLVGPDEAVNGGTIQGLADGAGKQWDDVLPEGAGAAGKYTTQ